MLTHLLFCSPVFLFVIVGTFAALCTRRGALATTSFGKRTSRGRCRRAGRRFLWDDHPFFSVRLFLTWPRVSLLSPILFVIFLHRLCRVLAKLFWHNKGFSSIDQFTRSTDIVISDKTQLYVLLSYVSSLCIFISAHHIQLCTVLGMCWTVLAPPAWITSMKTKMETPNLRSILSIVSPQKISTSHTFTVHIHIVTISKNGYCETQSPSAVSIG